MKSNRMMPISLTGIAVAELLDGAVNVSPAPEVRRVIFNPPATIVHWSDGTKTVARCNKQDIFSEEVGLAMACAKKLLHPYENFQECLKNAIRPKITKSAPKAEKTGAKAPIKRVRSAKPHKCNNPAPIEISLDEFLRLFTVVID